jgi:xanthine dehydrogenase accessory factor
MPEALRKAQAAQISKQIDLLLDVGRSAVLVTIIDGADDVGRKLLVDDSGAVTGSFSNGDLASATERFASKFLNSRDETKSFHVAEFAPELSEFAETRMLFERIRVDPRIVICGAGHVGAALARLAALMKYQVTLIDDRAEFLKGDSFPEEEIQVVVAESWAEAVINAVGDGAGVSIAIVTRGHNEDEECLRAVMSCRPDYVGLIGSKRRTNIVLQRLRDSGVDAGKMERVRAPIGLDIGAVTPEEVALSIMAEIIAERRGGKGGSMSAWRRT